MNKVVLTVGGLLLSGHAMAFPVAAGIAGAGLAGISFLPALVILAAVYWLFRAGKSRITIIFAVLAGITFTLSSDQGEDLGRAALFQNAPTDYLQVPVPFSFMGIEDQRSSELGVEASEFLDLMSRGEVEALRVSPYPSLFSEGGTLTVAELLEDSARFINRVRNAGKRVVLVDEYGGIAASVAEAAKSRLGVDPEFLVGGTSALSQLGVELGTSDNEISVDEYKGWIKRHPSAVVLGLTTDHEFVSDGWMYGDATFTLADLLSEFDALVQSIGGKEVFLASFETNDRGATPVIIELLNARGIEVTHVRVGGEEILVKAPYYEAYQNSERLLSISAFRRYMLTRPDVVFLDFSEQPWPFADNYLAGRYAHFPMVDVGRGGLQGFLDDLSADSYFVGLAFNRRTAYHSLLAGEYLTGHGKRWLGRFTYPQLMTDAVASNEEFNGAGYHFQQQLRTNLSVVGHAFMGSWWGLAGFLLASALLTYLGVLAKDSWLRNLSWITLAGAWIPLGMSGPDYPFDMTIWYPLSASAALYLLLSCYRHRQRTVSPIKTGYGFSTGLPPKAALLNRAAELGANVPDGLVVGRSDKVAHFERLPEGRYIVRSIHSLESESHGTTAGVFDSIVVDDRSGLGEATNDVLQSYGACSEGRVLIQPFIEAQVYGVAKYLSGGQSGVIACEVAGHGGGTDGTGGISRHLIRAGQRSEVPRYASEAATLLVDLAGLGAVSIEFAYSRDGLTLLQVNTDSFRACAENRYRSLVGTRITQTGCAHRNPLSAGIVASLSPGDVFAFGCVRYCRVSSRIQLLRTLFDDFSRLGVKPLQGASGLVELADHLGQIPAVRLSGDEPVNELLRSVKAQLEDAAQTVGRLNRAATILLSLGLGGSWERGARLRPTAILADARDKGQHPMWEGRKALPLSGYDAFASAKAQADFSSEDIDSAAVFCESPADYAKDIATTLMMVRLGDLQAAIESIIRQGAGQDLLNLLGTQAGYWEASTQVPNMPQLLGVGTFPLEPDNICGPVWSSRIPATGLSGFVSTPEDPRPGGILVLENCGMQHLPLIKDASAVLVVRGAITSHLIQHIEAAKIPVAVGVVEANALVAGDAIRVSDRGGVIHA